MNNPLKASSVQRRKLDQEKGLKKIQTTGKKSLVSVLNSLVYVYPEHFTILVAQKESQRTKKRSRRKRKISKDVE